MRTNKVIVRVWNRFQELESMMEFKSMKKATEFIDLYKLEETVISQFNTPNYDGTKDIFIDMKH